MANRVVVTERRRAEKQAGFAWAKYFQLLRENNENSRDVVRGIPRTSTGKLIYPEGTMPQHIVDQLFTMANTLNDIHTCPVCFEIPSETEFSVTTCGHALCGPCHDKVIRTSATQDGPRCPTCRRTLYPRKIRN